MASVREGGRQLRCSECARSRGKGEERPRAKGQPRRSREGRIRLSTGWTHVMQAMLRERWGEGTRQAGHTSRGERRL